VLIGYAHVSTDDRNLNLQHDALHASGCDKIFEDYISGAKATRSGLDSALEMLRSGDTLVVWRLDRLSRSIKDLIQMSELLKGRSIGLKSLTEAIDTTTSGGQLIFHIFAALAEFERNLIRERTSAGLAAARARGRVGGKPKTLDANKRQLAIKLYFDGHHTVKEICQMMGISKPTLYQYIDAESED
jgi:DNA invertase Pin-like site-specific DNA recombinase